MFQIEQARKELEDLLEILIEKTNFNQYLTGQVSFDTWRARTNKSLPDEIRASNGMSRFVFWRCGNPLCVFKMVMDDDIDYNANEAFIYQRAVEVGLEHWFARTEKIKSIIYGDCQTDFYAMEFCIPGEDELEEMSWDLCKKEYCEDEGLDPDKLTAEQENDLASWIDDDDLSGSDGMEHLMRSLYADEDVGQFYDFLEENYVNDTHCGNWGLHGNHWVLIDYAGYGHDIKAKVEWDKRYA